MMAEGTVAATTRCSPLNEKIGLPGGITFSKGVYNDSYIGSKEALVAAGVAREEWFPSAPQPGRRGYTKRAFKIQTQHGAARLDDRLRGRWELCIPIADAESAQRRAERERAHDLETAEQQQREQAAIAARWDRLELAPLSGNITEAEKRHLRILRTLSDDAMAYILDVASRLVVSDTEMETRGDDASPRRACLRLVVDNSFTGDQK